MKRLYHLVKARNLPFALRDIYEVCQKYSRFPWAFSCKDQSAYTVKDCLIKSMSGGGAPGYNHSDRGSDFMFKSMKEFLISSGIATSRTNHYHPRGNGQCEKFNGRLWLSIRLYLNSHGLPDSHWEIEK